MGSGSERDRRGFVRSLLAVGGMGAVAGCTRGIGSDGESGDIDVGAQIEAPAGGNADGSGYGEIESLSAAVESANTLIEGFNECGPETDLCLKKVNERLDTVEDVEAVATVEATTPAEARTEAKRLRDEIDRVQSDISDQIPREINTVAQERVGTKIIDNPDDLQSPEDFRKGAERASQIDRIASALTETAGVMEMADAALTKAADILEQAADAS